MRSDQWVIVISALILVAAVAGPIGSRYFPSQERLDAEYDAGYDEGLAAGQHHEPTTPIQPPGVARSANPSRETADLEASARKGAGAGLSGRDDELPRWDDTAEHLIELGRVHFEPLARDADPGQAFPTSPICDQLAAETARMLPAAPTSPAAAGPEIPAPDAARPRADWRTHSPAAVEQGASGAGSDIWERLAADLDDDPEINEWSAKADATRCTQIVDELRQLARTLETL